MKRVFLHYRGEYVHLPDGETVIGRDLGCRLRFNDAAVSRRHLIISVAGGTATVRDLGSTNGTKLNREPLEGERALVHRDQIRVGGRELTVFFLDEDEPEGNTSFNTAVDITPPPTPVLSSAPRPEPDPCVGGRNRRQTCSQCGAMVEPEDERCRTCGYSWADFRAHSPTSVGWPAGLEERRGHPRTSVEIPVVYASDSLEVQSVAKNLSFSGVFISTEFLDPIGTRCRVIVMVDGGPAVELTGVVTRSIEPGHPEGIPPGLAVAFDDVDEAGRQWLRRTFKSQLRIG